MPQKKGMKNSYTQAGSPCSHDTCNGMIDEDDKAMCCDSCLQWFHLNCTDLDTAIYDILIDTSVKGIKWFCEKCNPKFNELSELRATVTRQGKEFEKMSESINDLKNSYTTKLDELERIIVKDNDEKADLSKNVQTFAEVLTKNTNKTSETNNTISSINKNLNSVKNNIESKIEEEGEAKAKLRKANNICLFNLPESSLIDDEARDKEDVQKLQEVFKNRLIVNKIDIKFIRRIPAIRPVEAGKHPRPVIIKFSTAEKRNEALKLRNIKYTNSSTDTEHNIIIQQDRTKREQIEHKLLVKELLERREQEGKNLKIINNKIVEVEQPFRRNPQKFWGEL